MTQIELAKEICIKAHKGQTDKGGKPYYLHPFAVAEKCNSYNEKIVAYLHDVVEDTDYTLEDVKKDGFDDRVIEALRLLTHDESIDYDTYIKRLKKNDIARGVKIADLTHNSDLSRIPDVTEKDMQRIQKYQYYLKLLEE